MRLEQFFRQIASVTMKLTQGCNLKCAYCNTETVTPRTPMMSLDLYKRVATLLLENSQSRFVSLEFHGGEPMLLSDEWFEEAAGFAWSLARRHQKMLDLPMVTNGTLMTAERLDRLSKLGISFCLSCDGPPHINDVMRGGGLAVERCLRLFRERRLDVGVMLVMSHSNYAHMREVMEWFRGMGVASFAINFIQPQGRGIDSPLLDGEQMLEGIVQVIDHMVETEVSVYDAETARFVERFVAGRFRETQPSCWNFQCQAGRTYVAIDLHGNIHPCGSDAYQHIFGNVNDDLDEERYQRTLATLHDKGEWPIRCFDCHAKQICNHSCPTSDYNDLRYKENECKFTRLLWNHLCDHPWQATTIYEVLQARGMITSHAFVPLSRLDTSAVLA